MGALLFNFGKQASRQASKQASKLICVLLATPKIITAQILT